MPDVPKTRAAVIIAVGHVEGLEAQGLAKITSASRVASEIADWLKNCDPAFDVTLLTDEESAVKKYHVEEAIEGIVERPTYELLLVYFIGHGLFVNLSDTWLLSKFREDSRQSINLSRCIKEAQRCGIANVVFVSDACRSYPDHQLLFPTDSTGIFPRSQHDLPSGDVDSFLATSEYRSAYEAKIDGKQQPFLSYAFRRAFAEPKTNMVRDVCLEEHTYRVVPNRRLKEFLRNLVNQKLGEVDFTKSQPIVACVPSEDDVFVAPLDPDAIVSGADTSAGDAPGNGKARAWVSVARASGSGNALDETPPDIMPGLFRRPPAWRDELTTIEGIGPKLATRLNRIGIYQLAQIGEWGDPHIRWIEGRLPGPKGRISLKKWVDQARDLTGVGVPDILQPVQLIQRVLLGEEVNSLSVALRGEIDLHLPAIQVDQREIATGLVVSGAGIKRVVTPGGVQALAFAQRNDSTIVPLNTGDAASQAGIVLEDGRFLLLPVLPGYVGHVRIAPEGVRALAYVPPVGSPRRKQADAAQWHRIDLLRAAMTTAMTDNEFAITSESKARALLRNIRVGKMIDPILGVLSAAALARASQFDALKKLSDDMQEQLRTDLFDIQLLAYQDSRLAPIPSCPLLTEHWNLLEVRGMQDIAPIKARPHLENAFWTTSRPGADTEFFDHVFKKE